MRWDYALKYALKNLWVHRLRAVLTIGGVAIGTTSIVFLVSIGFGLEKLVTSEVANFDAFNIIDVPSSNLKTGKINSEAVSRIKQVPHVVSVDRIVDVAGRIKLSSQNSTTESVVVGVDPTYFKIAGIIPTNGLLFNSNADGVVINQVLANMIGADMESSKLLHSEISTTIIIPRDLRQIDTTEGPIEKELSGMKIFGIIDENQSPIAYFPIHLLENAGVTNNTSLKIRIDDRENVDTVRKSIENIGFSTEYVGDTINQISQVFSLFRIILASFGAIALLIAALGAFNILTISLMERLREVALLKTLGMKRKTIFKVFITESMSIGIAGGLIGIMLGYLIGQFLNLILLNLALNAGADAVAISYSPPSFIIAIAAGSIFVGFITGFYPAYRAIKTSTLDALRYE